MAIFSGFVRSPPPSPAERAVPNGGLGGLVQLKGKEEKATATKTAAKEAEGVGKDASTGRKSPPSPIRINSVNHVDPVVHPTPFYRRNHHTSPATLWKASHPPIEFTTGTAIVVTKQGVQHVQDISPTVSPARGPTRQSVQQDREGSENASISPQVQRRNVQSPVELQGSLLLPEHGFPGVARPLHSSDSSRPRTYSERSPSQASDLSIDPDVRSPSDKESVKTTFRRQDTPKQTTSAGISSPPIKLNSPGPTSSPVNLMPVIANVNTISAEDLIRILPMMKTNKLVSEWLPAMEKEIGKYKGLLHMYSNRSEVNACHIDSICQDLKNALGQMKTSALSANRSFEKAQADIDELRRTDVEKIQDTERELQEAFSACNLASEDIDLTAPEFRRLTQVLYRVVVALGGCIRNNLAFRLYHSHEGLSEEMVKILHAYKLWDDHTLKTFPALVPAEVYENAQQQAAKLRQQVIELQALAAEQQRTISHSANAYKKLESELQQQADMFARHIAHNTALEEDEFVLKRPGSSMQKDKRFTASARTTEEMGALADANRKVQVADTDIPDQPDTSGHIAYEQNRVIQDILRQVHELANDGSLIATNNGDQLNRLDMAVPSFRDAAQGSSADEYEPEGANDHRKSGDVTAPLRNTAPSAPSLHDEKHDMETKNNIDGPVEEQDSIDVNSTQWPLPTIVIDSGQAETAGEARHHFLVANSSKHGRNNQDVTASTTPYPRDSMIATNSLHRIWTGTAHRMPHSPPYPMTGSHTRDSAPTNAATHFNQIRFKAYSPPASAAHQQFPRSNSEVTSIDSRLHQDYFNSGSNTHPDREIRPATQEINKRQPQASPPSGHDTKVPAEQADHSPVTPNHGSSVNKHNSTIRTRR